MTNLIQNVSNWLISSHSIEMAGWQWIIAVPAACAALAIAVAVFIFANLGKIIFW